MVSTLDFGSDNPGSIPGIPTKPTRRFPGKNKSNMTIKETTSLVELANASGLSVSEFSNAVTIQLIARELIEGDDPQYWGQTIKEAIGEDAQVIEVINVIHYAGLLNVTPDVFDKFIQLQLMGHDDCPVCGGTTKVIDGGYKRIGGNGYDTPIELAAIWEEHECMFCGNREII